MYYYYLPLRPASIGTQPSGTREIINFDRRIYVEEIGRMAWAKVGYDRPLTEKEVRQYDLIPEKLQ